MNHGAFNSAYNITQYKISLAFEFNEPLLKKQFTQSHFKIRVSSLINIKMYTNSFNRNFSSIYIFYSLEIS